MVECRELATKITLSIMFQSKLLRLGKHQLIRFFDEDYHNELTLCLDKGGTWTSLVLDGHSIIDGYQSEEELDQLPAAKNVLLFPFVNRLKDGLLHWQDSVYQWPLNDDHDQHAIHGFGMHLPMSYTIQSLSPLIFDLYCRYNGQFAYYPFAFEFRTIYQLNTTGELMINMQVKNCDEVAFPFAMGFHPYLQISATIDQCHIDIPPVKKLCLDKRMIPTGQITSVPETKGLSLSNKYFDDCFKIQSTDKVASIRLFDEQKALTIWQNIEGSGFKYLQLYTPPHRKSIAIEPMTSVIDGLNCLQNECLINPGESRSLQWGLAFKNSNLDCA